MRHWLCPLLTLGTVLAFADVAPAFDPPADSKKIDLYIQLLGSKKFAERQKAFRDLEAIGAAALPALKKAAQSQDLEIQCRAEALLKKIGLQQQSSHLLAPRKVHLVCKNTPLPVAVAELSKKSGYDIQLQGNLADYASRFITLDTGETTFWEALAQLCQKAGLKPVEQPPPPKKINNNNAGAVWVTNKGGMGKLAQDIMKPAPDQLPQPIFLTSGRLAETPSHLAGAALVRLAEASFAFGKAPEWHLRLKVDVEPKLKWEDVLGVRIDKATDEHGEQLQQLITGFQKAFVPVPVFGKGGAKIMIVNGQVVSSQNQPKVEKQQDVLVKLLKGTKPTSRLKELSGLIFGQVQGQAQEMVRIDKITQAAGKTFRGKHAAIEVMEVKKLPDGETLLRLAVETPPRSLMPPVKQTGNTSIVVINGTVMTDNQDDQELSAQNFSLTDAKGNRFQITSAVNTGKGTASIEVVELTFRSGRTTGEPFQLIYTDRPSVIVEIPFTLRNVELQ